MTQREFEMRCAALEVERDEKYSEINAQRVELVNKISEAKNEYYKFEYELRTIIRDLDEKKRSIGTEYNKKKLEAYEMLMSKNKPEQASEE